MEKERNFEVVKDSVSLSLSLCARVVLWMSLKEGIV